MEEGGGEEEEEKELRSFKLNVHPKEFYTEDLIIRSEDFPDVLSGDVLELYHEEENFSRLLLQVKPENLYPENKLTKNVPREVVYVEKSIADTFHLINFKNIIVNKVEREKVALDVVELLFKDQYMGRSEMWRLKKSLVDSVVFINKKISFCKDAVRVTVLEMKNDQGDKLACGVVTQDTKVVFRSTTAMVYLFIQMSSEMWHFDMYGDLYFEKAVNGFLYEMFYKWKETGAAHEVTIVMFSRMFYDAKDVSEFPEHMISCIQKDCRDRFYEDFYRVAVQNERFEDWFPTLNLLRQTFTDYKELVLNYHQRPGVNIPKAHISPAAQGNFLETLNISLNTFEKHFINRNLDRTGQQAIVITPGVGIFEVDRELTLITKQRMIDSGVGSDLLCVGEQPLHAVPLFKMYSKGGQPSGGQEDFSMPWWINLSFYTSNKKIGYSSFIPRIKLPPLLNKEVKQPNKSCYFPPSIVNSVGPESSFEYDEYDAQVFNISLNKPYTSGSLPRNKLRKLGVRKGSSELKKEPFKLEQHRQTSRQGSYDDSFVPTRKDSNRQLTLSVTPSISIPQSLKDGKEILEIYSKSVGAGGELSLKHIEGKKVHRGSYDDGFIGPSSSFNNQKFYLPSGRALINPFDPSHVTFKLTSNRRRWTHIFPKGPTAVVGRTGDERFRVPRKRQEAGKRASEGRYSPADSTSSVVTSTPYKEVPESMLNRIADVSLGLQSIGGKPRVPRNRSESASEVKFGNFIWGATGEQTWDATLATGVDWKSITYPACLPITTDYKPDQRTLDTEYFISEYNLSPEEQNSDYIQRSPLQKLPLLSREVFSELISQRLAQNFQLIVNPKEVGPERADTSVVGSSKGGMSNSISVNFGNHQRNSLVRAYKKIASEDVWLSIGKIFHKLTLTDQTINVIRHSPKHPYPNLKYSYRYRFMAPDNDTYETSWVEFNMEKLEEYNWSYLDSYICTRGDQEYSLSESLKYWRYRLYVLPLKPFLPHTLNIVKGPNNQRCDIYPLVSLEDRVNLADGFMRFIETYMNKIKRPTSLAPEKPSVKVRSYTMAGELKPPGSIDRSKFRERLGSTKAGERDRTKSGPPKQLERCRTESGGRKDLESLKPLVLNQPSLSGSQENVFMGSIPCPDWQEFESKLLKRNCTYEEIVEAMRTGSISLCLLPKHEALPQNTFISADAVVWLLEHVEGVNTEKQAVQIMSGILEAGLICHACGHAQHPFVYGFYFYYFVCKDNQDYTGSQYNGDWEAAQADWMEVELELQEEEAEQGVHFLNPLLENPSTSSAERFRSCTLDPDNSKKSERPEWGQIKYQSRYRPDQAFEFLIKWSVATGAVIADMIRTWVNRAQSNQLTFIPIPGDPFALPSQNSDPIRGPIFVPLNTECLREGRQHLFSMFPEESWDYRLFLFREEIVRRFGFISSVTDPKQQLSSATFSTTHQYIHCTGNMFVLIPTTLEVSSNKTLGLPLGIQGMNTKEPPNRNRETDDETDSGALISRHLTGASPLMYGEGETGFLWSWNFMISKKWKSMSVTGATGDIAFMDKMLADFRRFCRNDECRLKEFWDECWQINDLQPQ